MNTKEDAGINPLEQKVITKLFDTPNKGGISVTIAQYCNFNFPYHTHDFNELVIVLSGTGIHVVNEVIYNLIPGDVFILNAGDRHEHKNTKNLVFCNITFLPGKLEALGDDIKTLPGFHHLFVLEPIFRQQKKYSSTFRLNTSQLIVITDLVTKMDKEYKSMLGATETMLTAYFMELVVYLCRQYGEFVQENPRLDIDIAGVLSFLESNYAQNIPLEELATIANLSASHFLKIFSEVMNITPIQYLKQLRIHKACHLIANTRLTMTEIAASVGIADSNYFSRAFKSVLGISPSRYREGS